MGEEISNSAFSAEDFNDFRAQLKAETALLAEWFAQSRFAYEQPVAGYELEACLVDGRLDPAPVNDQFLKILDSPLASPELARFNVEVNSTPRPIKDHVFSAFHDELNTTWQQCRQAAAELDVQVCAIGILPTLTNELLTLANMSLMERYRALNRQVLHLRKGKPLVFDINGVEHLRVVHRDVMLESAATSFQIHLQVDPHDAVNLFNTAMVLSGPMVALCANSPYFLGKDLWDETRIPLFEQSVATGGYDGAAFGPIRRVTFGSNFVRDSLMECFMENLDHYPVLLPMVFDNTTKTLPHLRLHNGTIWRWNRPLIGFDEQGEPHLRIEHRVVPAGPSLIDTVANLAFFYGALASLAKQDTPLYQEIDFVDARDNFYHAARLGLRASVKWSNAWQGAARDLLLEKLLPAAHDGLNQLGVASADINEYLGVIEGRLMTSVNGCQWQRSYVARHGRDMRALTAAYMERQREGKPVHEWTI
jgi:gamma-glutamyl:cysteine ligase YbdK (ATP-grasp superfamily)